ncbi:MAG TPA: exonuclease domain-containing protein, partial [Syntrophomonas sp.]|nr:exonuclease domain-containing protein [Syntrophomonas sp.]HRW13474.1 exonuclease domain-containing protein [Syntrophomonas sp.]
MNHSSPINPLGAIVDVETTGFSPDRDEIVELCIILFCVNHHGVAEIVDAYTGLREPVNGINAAAARVNGIGWADVCGRDLDHQRVNELIRRAEFFIAHNASFDRGFVTRLYPQAAYKHWYCSMSGINWRGKGYPNRRLQDLLTWHGIRPDRQHRAEDDVRATLALLNHCQSSGRTYLAELLERRAMVKNWKK